MTSHIAGMEVRVQSPDGPTAADQTLAKIYQTGLDINRGSSSAHRVASATSAALIRDLQVVLAKAAILPSLCSSTLCISGGAARRRHHGTAAVTPTAGDTLLAIDDGLPFDVNAPADEEQTPYAEYLQRQLWGF